MRSIASAPSQVLGDMQAGSGERLMSPANSLSPEMDPGAGRELAPLRT